MKEKLLQSAKEFRHGQKIYGLHVLGLLAPGETIPVFAAHQIGAEPLEGWKQGDLEQMVEEGRRQLDRQLSDLVQIRSRAQWLFTVGAGVLVALSGAFAAAHASGLLLALWLISLALVVYGVAGAGAILTVRADFKTIDTAVLSKLAPPILDQLAKSYSGMLSTGENTVATRLTVFRQAVVFVVLGGYLGLLAFLL